MIIDFVRDGHAWVKCDQCGHEMTILKYEFSKVYNFPVINHEKTTTELDAFYATHLLCKQNSKQLRIIDGQL